MVDDVEDFLTFETALFMEDRSEDVDQIPDRFIIETLGHYGNKAAYLLYGLFLGHAPNLH